MFLIIQHFIMNVLYLEIRLAVVEVGHPWKDVTVRRKLPPLKYIYDFEMSKCDWIFAKTNKTHNNKRKKNKRSMAQIV